MRVLAAAIGTVLGATCLVGCSSDSSDPKTLSMEDLEAALLTVDVLGDEFDVAQPDDDDEDDPGCLGEVPDLDDEDARAEALYRITDHVDVNLVVLDYEDEAVIEDALDGVAAAYEDCTSVDETVDGIRFELKVAADTETVDDVDQQVNSEVVGSLSFQEQEVPLHVSIHAVRIDDYMLGVAFVSRSEVGDSADLVLDAAIARFQAVRMGEEPPEQEPLLEDYIESLKLSAKA